MNTTTRILTLAAITFASAVPSFAAHRGASYRTENAQRQAPVVSQSGALSQSGKHVARTAQTNVSFKQSGLVIGAGSSNEGFKHINRNRAIAGSFKQAPLTQKQAVMASIN